MDQVKIVYDDDFETPEVRFIEFELADKKLKKINKRKWEKQKRYEDKNFKRIRKEIEDRWIYAQNVPMYSLVDMLTQIKKNVISTNILD